LPGNVTAIQRDNPAARCERHPGDIEQVSSGDIIEMMQDAVGHDDVEGLELSDEVRRDLLTVKCAPRPKTAMRTLDVPRVCIETDISDFRRQISKYVGRTATDIEDSGALRR